MAGKNRQASRGPGSPGREPGATVVSTAGDFKEFKGLEKHRKRVKSKAKKCKSESEEGELYVEPLNAWACLLLEAAHDPRASGGSGAQAVRVWRCDTLRLLPTPQQEELLRLVGDQTARLVNMENFRRRRLFFSAGRIDDSWRSAWDTRKTEYADIYRLLGSANFHETCRLIAEQWRSFKELLRAAKEGRLPPWLRVHPPGYRKDKEGQRIPIVIVRYDNFRVDLERRVIHFNYWNISIPFKGKPRWLAKPGAKQGRLIITYDPVKKRWYARVSVEVTLERERGGSGFMGIDLGREILVSAVASDGTALLYKGSALKADYFYFERRIAEVDKALSDPGMEEADRAVLWEERRRLYGKRSRRRDQVFANTAAHLARFAREHSIGAVFIGYPWNISHEKPGKGNTNMWSQRKLMLRLATTLENHGIAAFAVREGGTSKTCAYHGCKVQRGPRGLVRCPHGHTLHADVNAALNILLRGLEALGVKVSPPERVKVLSFIPTPGGVVERKRNQAP